jgi:hypothetical protein
MHLPADLFVPVPVSVPVPAQECEAAAPPGLWDEAGIRKLGAREGFRALILSLWDPDQRRYVPFPEWAWLDKLLVPDCYKEASKLL